MCLPAKLASSLGGVGPLVLVTRVTNAITMTDPLTLRHVALDVRRRLAACCCCFPLMPAAFGRALPPPSHSPTSKRVQTQSATYWRSPIKALSSSRALVEYVVLDIEALHGANQWAAGSKCAPPCPRARRVALCRLGGATDRRRSRG